jgi:hypothetical protein
MRMNQASITITKRSIASLKPYPGNARTHSKQQIRQIARSIERFGFTNPVLIGDDGEIIAGHGRVAAAKSLGWQAVPTIALAHLDPAERRAYVLADNKLALGAGWDREILAIELQVLAGLEFDVELTGFSLSEIDLAAEATGRVGRERSDPEQARPESGPETAVTRHGETWLLDRHGALRGNLRKRAAFAAPAGDGPFPEGTIAVLVTDPQCCDAIVREWEQRTRRRATLARTGATFEDMARKSSPSGGGGPLQAGRRGPERADLTGPLRLPRNKSGVGASPKGGGLDRDPGSADCASGHRLAAERD